MRFYRFTPLYQERVWGGHALADKLGRKLPDGGPIGESWEVVDRPEAESVVAEGPDKGLSLRSLIETKTGIVMGPGWDAKQVFPILVKWLDCADRLSLQVHPPADIAEDLGGEPKTECWYVAASEPGAGLLVGLKEGVTRQEFEQALHDDELEPLVQRIPTHPGTFMFVHSGRIHAIDAGNLILEIQQNSDTTYRVYDWGRVGLDGEPRQLHIEQSMKSIDFDDFEPDPVAIKDEPKQRLVTSDVFTLDRYKLKAGETLTIPAHEEPRLLGLVEGVLTEADGSAVAKSENILLPYAEAFSFTAQEKSTVLVTSGFAG